MVGRSTPPIAALIAMLGACAVAHAASTDSLATRTSAGARLRLDGVVARVLDRNPGLAAAQAAIDASRAGARAEGAWGRAMVDVMVAPQSLGPGGDPPGYRVGVTQPLGVFGQRGLARRAGAAEGAAATYDLAALQLDLVREARVTFAELWRIERALERHGEVRDLLQQVRRTALARYAAGLVEQQDPLAAEAEIAMIDHQLNLLERQRTLVRARLNVLMHDPPSASLPPAPDTLPLPDTTLAHSGLVPHARALRPELRAADAMVEAERARATLAGREALGDPALLLAWDRFMNEPEWRGMVGVSTPLPLGPGGGARRAEARARLAGSEARREAMRDSVALEVEEAAARLHELAHDVEVARDRMVPLAERAVRATRSSYETGRTTFPALLGAERDLLRARLEADQSLAQLVQARADLDRALGNPVPHEESHR